jgi:outer membrane protein TolC
VLSFGLSQSLLKDSFGLATRSKIEAASLASEASKLEYQDKIQAYSLDLAQVFYDAWLAKESHTAAKESFNRRARTLKVTQIRNRRGTSERPDLLQAQAAETESKLLVTDAHLNLQDKWRALVISLKLPKEWIEIDAVEIPLKISNETPKAQETCNRVKKTNEPTPSYMVEVLEKITKATELRLKAAQNEKYPAVDLVGSYAVNSVDPNDRTQTSREVWDRQFPAWSVGLKVTYPIGSPIERANHQRAMVEHVQNTTRLQEAKDQLELTWITLCERLETLNTKAKEFETSVSQQTKRERLESQRFNIGSVPLLNVIQSGDDETRTRQNLLQTKANLELTALQILAFDRKLFSRVEGFTHEKND